MELKDAIERAISALKTRSIIANQDAHKLPDGHGAKEILKEGSQNDIEAADFLEKYFN